MSWRIARVESCPASRPFGVVKEADGHVEGCHPSRSAALAQMAALYAAEATTNQGKTMEHIHLKAVATVADQGIFTAVISTSTPDRENDVVDAGGMVEALHKWVPTGKNIPLAWNHSTAPEDQIGHIDPASARTADRRVVVDGWIDQSTAVGQEAWRLVKSGTLGFSFGYMILDATERKGGGRNISQLDVFEITATPTPMNNDTRVLDYKAPIGGHDRVLNSMMGQAQEYIDAAPDEQHASAMRDILGAMRKLMGGKALPRDEATLRRETELLERERIRETLPEATEPVEAEPVEVEDAEVVAETDNLFTDDELAGVKSGEFVKAVWTTAYINGLPDSSFLYIESGGTKDDQGKTTPRSLRHFPYKDDSGSVDLPHLRNALARIPQSNLPQNTKDSLTAKAQRILDAQKSVSPVLTESGQEARPRSADPLRARSDKAALEIQLDGLQRRKQPNNAEPAQSEPPPEAELKRKSREHMLEILSGT